MFLWPMHIILAMNKWNWLRAICVYAVFSNFAIALAAYADVCQATYAKKFVFHPHSKQRKMQLFFSEIRSKFCSTKNFYNL